MRLFRNQVKNNIKFMKNKCQNGKEKMMDTVEFGEYL